MNIREDLKPKLVTLTELCYGTSVSRREREALVDGVIEDHLSHLKSQIEQMENIEQLKELLSSAPPQYKKIIGVETPRDLYFSSRGKYEVLSDILALFSKGG